MNRPSHFPQSNNPVWDTFYTITQIPRPSGGEEKFREYLKELAVKKNLEVREDVKGNIVLVVPGKKDGAQKDTLIIQNHLDMVCDKLPGNNTNFSTDPIQSRVENGWIVTEGTTLGADNGIGCAAALALIDADVSHPPLELLFTVEEETGLFGASALDASILTGKKMLNLDTEEWGSIYVGCAGGIDFELTKNTSRQNISKKKVFKIELAGLCGGHSGIDIHRNRGNAIKLLAETLWELRNIDFELVEFRGGKAHNIIPRDAFAVIAVDDENKLNEVLKEKNVGLRTFLPKEDHKLHFSVEETKAKTCLSSNDRDQFLTLLNLFPHGAHSYFWEAEETLVSQSNNLAKVLLVDENIYFQTSLRFSDNNELKHLVQKVEALALQFELKTQTGCSYPGWKPQFHGELLDLAKAIFKEKYGIEAKVKAVHAGLECGIIKEKLGEIDVISFGPEITGAHSPSESLEVESTDKFWDYLLEILARM